MCYIFKINFFFLTDVIGNAGPVLLPYLQNQLPGQSSLVNLNNQQSLIFNDFLTTQLIQQTLSCD